MPSVTVPLSTYLGNLAVFGSRVLPTRPAGFAVVADRATRLTVDSPSATCSRIDVVAERVDTTVHYMIVKGSLAGGPVVPDGWHPIAALHISPGMAAITECDIASIDTVPRIIAEFDDPESPLRLAFAKLGAYGDPRMCWGCGLDRPADAPMLCEWCTELDTNQEARRA